MISNLFRSQFANPGYLYLLLIIPLLILLYIFVLSNKYPSFQFPSYKLKIKKSWKEYLLHVLFGVEMLALVLLILALARPQSSESNRTSDKKGIDIMMAVDISGSMLAEDFQPNRIEAAKKVASKFIQDRKDDKIGLVVFSGEAFTQCPLTTDHDVLISLFEEVSTDMIDDATTAIGMGLATCVARLKDSEVASKVVILLTDGVNNSGSIAPITAAEMAKSFGIRVYTIGVGSKGTAPYPTYDVFGNKRYQSVEVDIDEDVLKEISSITGGKYFRATDNNSLYKIYSEIDKMEKSKIEVYEFESKYDEYLPLVLLAFILICVDFILRGLVIRTFP